MATTMSSVLNSKFSSSIINNIPKSINSSRPIKQFNLLSMQNLPKGLSTTTSSTTPAAAIDNPISSPSITSTALASAFFYTLSSCNPAFASQQLAEIAEGTDNRGLALLLPIIPAIAWVLFNILQPALNQINKMRNSKAIIIGLGLGGLASSGFLLNPAPATAAAEIAMLSEGSSDNRGQLLLFVIAPAIAWVLYNILQPALNQINKMRNQ